MPLEPAACVRAHVVCYQYVAFAVIRRQLAEIFRVRRIAYLLPVHLKHKAKAGRIAVLRWNGSQHYYPVRCRNVYPAASLRDFQAWHDFNPCHFSQLLLGNRRIAASIAIDYAFRCYEQGQFPLLVCNIIYNLARILRMVGMHVCNDKRIQVCRLQKQLLPCQKRSLTRVNVHEMLSKADENAAAVLGVIPQVFPAAPCPKETYAPL